MIKEERINNYIDFVIEDQIVMQPELPERCKVLNQIKSSTQYKAEVRDWMECHDRIICDEDICNRNLYRLTVDGINLVVASISKVDGDFDPDELGFEYEKEYSHIRTDSTTI